MARHAISSLGLTQSSSAAKNARLLNSHLAQLDDGDVVAIGRGAKYSIADGVVRCMRGNLTIEGAAGCVLEYSSEGADKSVGNGTCLTFGFPDPSLLSAGKTSIAEKVTLRGVGFHDLSTRVLPVYDVGHWPSPVEFFFIEDGLVEYCRFPNGMGNSGLNILGLSKNQFESYTQRFTVQYNVFGSDASMQLQGDGVNLGGVSSPVFRGNTCAGGVGRHFIELGTGIVDLLVEDNDGDLQGGGMTHLGSWTASRSALIQRNKFRNWGYKNGSSSITILPDAPRYDDHGNSIFVDENGNPLPVNKVWGVRLVANLFEAGPECWPAALTVEGGDLCDHVYSRNTFRCSGAIYLVQQPRAPFQVSDNDVTANALFFLAQQMLSPQSDAFIGRNTLRGQTKLFDVDANTWVSDPRVTGLDTNIRSAL
jgi:hypothetical protein